MRRVPDRRIRPKERPHGGGRQIVLTEMHAGGAAQRGNIDAIVDDDEGIVCARRGDGGIAELDEWTRFDLLGANLQEGGTAIEEGAQEVERRPAGGRGRVDVDDGVKRTQRASRPLASA